jgi:hypothetical protein
MDDGLGEIIAIVTRAPSFEEPQNFRNGTPQNFWNHQYVSPTAASSSVASTPRWGARAGRVDAPWTSGFGVVSVGLVMRPFGPRAAASLP